MSNAAFDTLGAARKLKASGLAAEQSETIVEVVSQSTSQFVTVEHFDAGIEMLQGRIDAVRSELRAEIWRSILIAVGINSAAVGLMMTVLGYFLTSGAVPVPP